MKTITIKNLLNHENEVINLQEGINLITGRNGDGKTNLARIISALASHTGNPAGLSAAHAKAYITDGKTSGFAVDERNVRWTPPDRFVVPDDVTPQAFPHTVNLVDFVANSSSTSRKKRSESYEDLFLPKDAKALLEPAWTKRNLPKGQLTAVVKMIEDPRHGWTGAQNLYADKARDAKRLWGNVTGKKWGVTAAPKWKPEDWEADMEGLSEDDVLQALSDAQEALRAIGVKHAVSEERIQMAVEIKESHIPAKQEEIRAIHKAWNDSKAECVAKKEIVTKSKQGCDEVFANIQSLESARQEGLREIHKLKELDYAECWNCGVKIDVMSDNQIRKPQIENVEKDMAEWAKSVANLEESLTALRTTYATASAEYKQHSDELNTAVKLMRGHRDRGIRAKAELDELVRRSSDADLEPSRGNEMERSSAENERDRCDRRRKCWVANDKAQKIHKDVVGYLDVEALLRPTGVREAVIRPKMEKLRAALLVINRVTKWNFIDINEEYEITSNDRPVALVSQHEQYQAQWALQVAVAMIVPSTQVLVLDCCDVVRGGNWGGLSLLLKKLYLKRQKDRQTVKEKYPGRTLPPLCIVLCATETEAEDGWNEIWLGEDDE